MTLNLEVAIELLGYGLSSNTSAITYNRTRYDFDASDYDGATYYFEVVARNNDSAAKDVILRDVTNSVDRATVSVTNGGSVYRLRSSSFSPASGRVQYKVITPATTSANQLIVTAARIIVVQTNATKTELVYPLAYALTNSTSNGDSSSQAIWARGTGSATYATSDYARNWYRDDTYLSTVGSTAWTFSGVLGSNSTSTSREAFMCLHTTGGTAISATELLASGVTTPVYDEAFFDSSATSFADHTSYDVRIKNENASYNAYCYRAELRVKLTSLSKAVVEKQFGGYYSGTANTEMYWQRILHTNANWQSGYTVAMAATGKVSTTENANLLGVSPDSNNTGSATVGSPYINWNTNTTKIQLTTSTFSPTDTYDMFAETVASTATQTVTVPVIVYTLEATASPITLDTVASTLTGALSSSATVGVETNISSAASTLSGPVSSAATVTEEFAATAASQLTGPLSADASVTSLLAITSTSAPQLTGALSSSASVKEWPYITLTTQGTEATICKYDALQIEFTTTPITYGTFSAYVVDNDTNEPWTPVDSEAANGSSAYQMVADLSGYITSDNYRVYIFLYDGVDQTPLYAWSPYQHLVEFQSTAASTLTGPLSSNASVTQLLAITSTGASQLTSPLTSSASVDTGGGTAVEATAASTLSAPVTCAATAQLSLTITLPSITGTYSTGQNLTVTWTTSIAVSAGEFAIWADSGGGLYVGKIVSPNGTTNYSDYITLDVPIGNTYSVRVGYRWIAGTGEWTDTGQSSDTFVVVQAITSTAASQLTGPLTSGATAALNYQSTAASQLTGALSSSASVTNTPPARTSTAASTLTGALSASATVTYTPPARTSTAASTLTGALSSSASVSYTPPARTSTAASTLTGALSSSATIGNNVTSTTITAASDLSLHAPANFIAYAASTLTSPLTSATSVVSGTLNIFVTAASTITENAPAPRMVSSDAYPTAMVSSAASLYREAGVTGGATLTGAISSSASITRTALATTSTAASTLTTAVSSTTYVSRQVDVQGASTLTGMPSSEAFTWNVTAGNSMIFAASQFPGVSSTSYILSSSLVSSVDIQPNISSSSQINREILTGWISGEGVLTSTVNRCRCTIRVRYKIRHTRLYGKIGRVEDTTLHVKHKGGATWPSA